MAHLETGAADRNAVRADGEIVFIFELGSTFVVEVNERRDALLTAILVKRHSVVSGVQKELGNLEVW